LGAAGIDEMDDAMLATAFEHAQKAHETGLNVVVRERERVAHAGWAAR